MIRNNGPLGPRHEDFQSSCHIETMVTQRYPKTKTDMLVISSVVIPPSPTSQRSLNQAAAVPLNMLSRSAWENPATIS